MLNISEKNIVSEKLKGKDLTAFNYVTEVRSEALLAKVLFGLLAIIVIGLFLPWTQNITANGKVTTLTPESRPQTIQSTIAGRIEKWYIHEGQKIKKGDTIAHVSEVKAEYFDPELILRTQEQLDAKSGALKAYESKIEALNRQLVNIRQARSLKGRQLQNKIEQGALKVLSDSMKFVAAIASENVANAQLIRQEELFKQGLKSLTDLEEKRIKLQETAAKKTAAQNQFFISKNNYINAQLELNTVNSEYDGKIAKAQSDRFSALSIKFEAAKEVAKLKNQLTNYQRRAGFYYILSPKDGYVVKTLVQGTGEMVKEGKPIATIMPENYELAVELFVEPVDMPLIHEGSKIRFVFDGWPSLVFSGWPGMSFGTFGGEVYAIDRTISSNGKYRLLVRQDYTDVNWPDALRVGSGANGIALLNDVALWYELWRRLNGFPPDFYTTLDKGSDLDSKSSKKNKK